MESHWQLRYFMATRYLAELIFQKEVFDKKISELKKLLKNHQTDAYAEELNAMLELRQGTLITIKAANEASKIKIGGSEVPISIAVLLRDTVKEKIDIMTDLIEDENCNLDKIKLQKQRDKYYDEYALLSMGINRNDLQVTVG